jgi:hypothetical protein
MLKRGLQLIISILILSIFTPTLFAQEMITVQTFTFDDILKRRGEYEFPSPDEEFRKVEMIYTLKCDYMTARDRFACGEWDYLTYTKIYLPTGVMDSTAMTHPLFKVGRSAPETYSYVLEPTYTTYQKEVKSMTIDNIVSENEYEVGTLGEDLLYDNTPSRMQFLIPKDALANAGLESDRNIQRIALYVENEEIDVKNLTIKLETTVSKKLTKFYDAFDAINYQQDTKLVQGWNILNLIEPIEWRSIYNILVEISYDGLDPDEQLNFKGFADILSLSATGGNNYLTFDGANDYVDCGDLDALDGAEKFTMEGWIKIDNWKNWTKVMGKGSRTFIECSNSSGTLHCNVRNPENTYGKATGCISLGRWNHIAMVFDGTQENDADKLKLYVNGGQRTLEFRGFMPDMSEDIDDPFTISGRYSNDSYFRGDMDEVRVWSDALTKEEIEEWMFKSVEGSHPKFASLEAYYPIEEGMGYNTMDVSANAATGILVGAPDWQAVESSELLNNAVSGNSSPAFKFFQGEYETRLAGTIDTDIIENPPTTVEYFEVQGNDVARTEIIYTWPEGYVYTYNTDGEKIDSAMIEGTEEITNSELNYFSEPFEVLDIFEIGRFITPYGINLDLGEQGFTWKYDVTDYSDLLRGTVDISAGNLQELIDLKFIFYKGTPPRDVVEVTKVWGDLGSYRYRDLDDDTRLPRTTINLDPDAKQFKFKSTITGHGHHSSDGNYPHCCEWRNNTHYLKIGENGENEIAWNVWLDTKCGLNPVHPQGGNWPGAREGWCPADVVDVWEFELTEYIDGNTIDLDYAITPVPASNQGMGNGNYIIASHLMQYKDANNTTDIEVYDVMRPNDWEYYSKINPCSEGPIIVVRNNGSEAVTSMTITYGVSGGEQEVYNWVGELLPNRKDTLYLPIQGDIFWKGDEDRKFTATVSDPNEGTDDYPANNSYTTNIVEIDVFTQDLVLELFTNPRGYTGSSRSVITYEIVNSKGELVHSSGQLSRTTLYKDELDLPNGYYTLYIYAADQMGLHFLMIAGEQGYAKFTDKAGNLLRGINPDFGVAEFYSFVIDKEVSVKDNNDEALVSIYPQPVSDELNIFALDNLGNARIQVIDIEGRVKADFRADLHAKYLKTINTEDWYNGMYILKITNDRYSINKKFIKNR